MAVGWRLSGEHKLVALADDIARPGLQDRIVQDRPVDRLAASADAKFVIRDVGMFGVCCTDRGRSRAQ
jgi:hypothetical protein